MAKQIELPGPISIIIGCLAEALVSLLCVCCSNRLLGYSKVVLFPGDLITINDVNYSMTAIHFSTSKTMGIRYFIPKLGIRILTTVYDEDPNSWPVNAVLGFKKILIKFTHLGTSETSGGLLWSLEAY